VANLDGSKEKTRQPINPTLERRWAEEDMPDRDINREAIYVSSSPAAAPQIPARQKTVAWCVAFRIASSGRGRLRAV